MRQLFQMSILKLSVTPVINQNNIDLLMSIFFGYFFSRSEEMYKTTMSKQLEKSVKCGKSQKKGKVCKTAVRLAMFNLKTEALRKRQKIELE